METIIPSLWTYQAICNFMYLRKTPWTQPFVLARTHLIKNNRAKQQLTSPYKSQRNECESRSLKSLLLIVVYIIGILDQPLCPSHGSFEVPRRSREWGYLWSVGHYTVWGHLLPPFHFEVDQTVTSYHVNVLCFGSWIVETPSSIELHLINANGIPSYPNVFERNVYVILLNVYHSWIIHFLINFPTIENNFQITKNIVMDLGH